MSADQKHASNLGQRRERIDGQRQIDRMLLFRDRLRDHAGDRTRYEETKRGLAARTWKYRQDYADARSIVVEEILPCPMQPGGAAGPPALDGASSGCPGCPPLPSPAAARLNLSPK